MAAIGIGQVDPGTPASDCAGGSAYFQYANGAAQSYVVPAGGGVITSWSTKAGPGDGQNMTFKVLAEVNSNDFKVVGTSVSSPLTASSLNTFATRIPVSGGETIGMWFPTTVAEACNYNSADAADVQAIDARAAGPDPSAGTDITPLDTFTKLRINLQATVEPDADHDGFGDETQDACVGTAGPQNGCPTPPNTATTGVAPVTPSGVSDKTKPTLGGLSFSTTTFEAAKSGASTAKKHKVKVGTKVSFSLSEASSVKFTVQRKTKGRKVGHKCKTKTNKNAKKKSCTLWKSVKGSFTVAGKAGKNTFKFRGRVGGKSLKPGSYRLNSTATDPSKNASAPKRKGFKIVR